jgi:hypothetical protein
MGDAESKCRTGSTVLFCVWAMTDVDWRCEEEEEEEEEEESFYG